MCRIGAREFIDARVMGHDDDGPGRGQQLRLDESDDIAPGVAVERGGGLVEDQDVGLGDDGPGDGHSLLFAAAELHRLETRAVGQADDGEIAPRLSARSFHFDAPQDQRDGDVLGGRQPGKEVKVLKHEADVVQSKEGVVAGTQGPDVDALDQDPAARGPQDAEIMLSRVVLPLPEGPTM